MTLCKLRIYYGEGTLGIDDVALTTGEEQPRPAPTAEPVEEPAEEPIEEPVKEPVGEPEKESGGGICPGAAALRLGAVGVLLACQRRRGETKDRKGDKGEGER